MTAKVVSFVIDSSVVWDSSANVVLDVEDLFLNLFWAMED